MQLCLPAVFDLALLSPVSTVGAAAQSSCVVKWINGLKIYEPSSAASFQVAHTKKHFKRNVITVVPLLINEVHASFPLNKHIDDLLVEVFVLCFEF